MPQLPRVIWLLLIESVFEFDVSEIHHAIELGLVHNAAEIERLAWIEDGRVLREVAIVRIVQAVWKPVSFFSCTIEIG
jgi:hypothetical protein